MARLKDEVFPRPVEAVEVAPGVTVLPGDLKKVPAFAINELRQKRVIFLDSGKEGVAMIPVRRVQPGFMRLTEAERLPLGLSVEVISTLVRAGFVEGGSPAPSTNVVNVLSLLEHYYATLEDPEYWTAERRQRYRDAMPENRRPRPRKRRAGHE